MGFDQIAEALGNHARRQVLLKLLDHNPVNQSNVLASDGPGAKDEREVQLIHTHLPKLDSMGYIVWDRDHATITKGPNWEEIQPVVQLLNDNRDRIPTDTFEYSH